MVFKNVIDWSDGLLARIKTTSNLGDVLDRWGSIVGYNSFIFGFGFYLYHDSDNNRFFNVNVFNNIFKVNRLKRFLSHLIASSLLKKLARLMR